MLARTHTHTHSAAWNSYARDTLEFAQTEAACPRVGCPSTGGRVCGAEGRPGEKHSDSIGVSRSRCPSHHLNKWVAAEILHRASETGAIMNCSLFSNKPVCKILLKLTRVVSHHVQSNPRWLISAANPLLSETSLCRDNYKRRENPRKKLMSGSATRKIHTNCCSLTKWLPVTPVVLSHTDPVFDWSEERRSFTSLHESDPWMLFTTCGANLAETRGFSWWSLQSISFLLLTILLVHVSLFL